MLRPLSRVTLKPLLRLTLKVFEALPSELLNTQLNSSPCLLKLEGTLNCRVVQVSLLRISAPFRIRDPYFNINYLRILIMHFYGNFL